jgi:hypothetical protein
MKSPGVMRPALGVVPAHERLGGGHVAGGELDDRLQLDDQLAALGRALEVLLQRWRRRTAACIAGSKTSWRCLPAFLAVYMATSALRSSSSALSTSAVQPLDDARGSRAPRSRGRRPRTGARAAR